MSALALLYGIGIGFVLAAGDEMYPVARVLVAVLWFPCLVAVSAARLVDGLGDMLDARRVRL